MAHYKGASSEGGRALQLQKQREKALEDLELRKKKIEDELKLSNIGSKFKTHYDAIEQQIKSSTVGLVTLDEMRAKQEDLVKEREMQLALKKESIKKQEIESKKEQLEKQKRQVFFLGGGRDISFIFDLIFAFRLRHYHLHLTTMMMKRKKMMKNLIQMMVMENLQVQII